MHPETPQETVAALDEAFNRGDLEAVLAHYEDTAVLMVDPARSLAGKEALRGAFAAFLRSGAKASQDAVRVIQAQGVALFLSRWTLVTPEPGGGQTIRRFTATSVLRQDPAGRWRLAIDNGFGPMVLDAGRAGSAQADGTP